MNEQVYIAFENYLHNEMSNQERLEFENQLQNDAEVREKFELYKETTQFLAAKFDSDTVDFKKNLETISKEHFSEKSQKSKVIKFKPWHYAVAASVVIVFGMLFTMQGNPEYTDYNQHENAYFVERGDDDTNLKQAQDYFNAHDYKNSAIAFESIHLLKPEWEFYYAIALIETNSFEKAEYVLKHLKNGTTVYKDKATWYLALSNLKQKKFDECKSYLNQIPTDTEDYEKAQKLLKDLE